MAQLTAQAEAAMAAAAAEEEDDEETGEDLTAYEVDLSGASVEVTEDPEAVDTSKKNTVKVCTKGQKRNGSR